MKIDLPFRELNSNHQYDIRAFSFGTNDRINEQLGRNPNLAGNS